MRHRFGLEFLPLHADKAKSRYLRARGRIGVAAILFLPLALATSCGSATGSSAGLVLPISCSTATACLKTARMDGFHKHVLTPVGGAISVGKSWYYPPRGHLGWGFALSYRDVEVNQIFVETVGMKPIVYPCLVQLPGTQVETSHNGYQVCLTFSRMKEAARFYSSGALYQLTLSGSTNLDARAQKEILLGIVEQLR